MCTPSPVPNNTQRGRRVLITDINHEFGKKIYPDLQGLGCLIFTFIPDCSKLESTMHHYPDALPVLLNLNVREGKDAELGLKLLEVFPLLDYIINFSGDDGMEVISKVFTTDNWEVENFEGCEPTSLISKMDTASSNNHRVLFNFINRKPENHEDPDAILGEEVDLQPTPFRRAVFGRNSVPRRLIRSFRKSFRKWNPLSRKKKSSKRSKKSKNIEVPEVIIPPTSSPTPPPSHSRGGGTPLPLTLPQNNDAIRKAMETRNMKTLKRWKDLENYLEKQMAKKFRRVERDLEKLRKDETVLRLQAIAETNAQTASRAKSLSPETAERIIASREARVHKEVNRIIERRRMEETRVLENQMELMKDAMGKTLYHNTIIKQLIDFSKMKKKKDLI